METKTIIHQLLQQEFIHDHYAEILSQYLKCKVHIPELKQFLMSEIDTEFDHNQQHLPIPPSVSQHPICAYLYSVQQHSQHSLIQQWAIHNLHAACILKSIQNKGHKDHQTTIIKILDRISK